MSEELQMAPGLTLERGDTIVTIDPTPMLIDGAMALKFEKLDDRKVKLDEQKAEWYIGLPEFEGERSISNPHVQTLLDAMKNDTFLEDSVVLVSADYKGVTHKINAHHTCWAIILVQTDRPGYSLTVREIRYRVKTPEQLRMLYARFDVNKPRTKSHLTQVHLAGLTELQDLPRSVKNRIIPGFKQWQFDETQIRRITPDQVAAIIQENYLPTFLAVGEFMRMHMDDLHIRRGPVIAAMFETFHKTRTKAPEFWEPVATGVGIDDYTDPRYHLQHRLRNSAIRSKGDKKHVTEADLYTYSLVAWNHWRSGSKIERLQLPTSGERPKAK